METNGRDSLSRAFSKQKKKNKLNAPLFSIPFPLLVVVEKGAARRAYGASSLSG